MASSGHLIVHAADLHLASPMRVLEARLGQAAGGLSAQAAQALASQLANAPWQAFERLIAHCIEQRAALLILAGDVFDGGVNHVPTLRAFERKLAELTTTTGCRVVMLRGNHDADNDMKVGAVMPEGAVVLRADRPESVHFEDLGVVVHGQSFATAAVTDNLVRSYPDPVPGLCNIGVLHTALEDAGGVHARYAPCTLQELTSHRYDYWALGHVHNRATLHRSPWVVFPGNLQGRSVRETGPKGAMQFRVEGGRVVDPPTFIELDVARFELVTLRFAQGVSDADIPARDGSQPSLAKGAGDASASLPVDSWRDAIHDALRAVQRGAQGRPALVRLVLEGARPDDLNHLDGLDGELSSIMEALNARAAAPVLFEKIVELWQSAAPPLSEASAQQLDALMEDSLAAVQEWLGALPSGLSGAQLTRANRALSEGNDWISAPDSNVGSVLDTLLPHCGGAQELRDALEELDTHARVAFEAAMATARSATARATGRASGGKRR